MEGDLASPPSAPTLPAATPRDRSSASLEKGVSPGNDEGQPERGAGVAQYYQRKWV